jgi:hypothetical protein
MTQIDSKFVNPSFKWHWLFLLGGAALVNQSTDRKQEKVQPVQSTPNPAPQSSQIVLTKSEDEVIEIFQHIAWDWTDTLKLVLISILTFGAGAVIYPAIEFWHLQKTIPKIKIGKRKLRWVATLEDWYTEVLKIWLWNFCTLGFYSLLGFAEERRTKFIDKYIAWAN